MGNIQRLIAFDLDGTLIDSRRDLADSANDLIVTLGGAPLPEEAITAMVGEGAPRDRGSVVAPREGAGVTVAAGGDAAHATMTIAAPATNAHSKANVTRMTRMYELLK